MNKRLKKPERIWLSFWRAVFVLGVGTALWGLVSMIWAASDPSGLSIGFGGSFLIFLGILVVTITLITVEKLKGPLDHIDDTPKDL